jgi:hypothetical protein
MSDSMIWRWVRHFIEGRENVHDDPRSGPPPVVNEDLVRAVKKIPREQTIHHFITFPALFTNFSHFFTKLCLKSFVASQAESF